MERKTGSFKNIWKAAVSGILFAVSVALVFCDQTAKADEEYVSWKLESGESIDAAKDDYVITHTDQMSEEDASLYKKKYVLKNLHGETVLLHMAPAHSLPQRRSPVQTAMPSIVWISLPYTVSTKQS